MDAEPLFIRRCEQAAILIQSNDEAEILDLAGLLRQLLLDRYKLMDTVNKNRIKPRFHVGLSRYPADDPFEDKTFWTILDGLDPEIRPPGTPSANLTRDEFLKHIVINYFGNKITILDIIDHAANEAGGVHHDPRPKTSTVARAAQKIKVKGFDIPVYHLKGIATVALRALQPLIDDVKNRQQPSQTAAPVPSPNKSV